MTDYITQPRSSGYRSVHVVVSYDDRPIEVQLRTGVMHEWAVTVERLGGRMMEDLKSGRGPQPVLEWLKAISEAMATEEAGLDVAPELLHRLPALRAEAVPFLRGGQP